MGCSGRPVGKVLAAVVILLLALYADVALGAPTVSLTTPHDHDWTGNSIEVGATAADDVGLTSIELWGNGAIFSTISCSTTSCGGTTWWTTGPLPAGAYEINAVATDVAGNRTVSPTVTIYKDAQSPVYASGALSSIPPSGLPLTAGFDRPANGATVCGSVLVVMLGGGGADPDQDGIVIRHFTLAIDGTTVKDASSRVPLSHQEQGFNWATIAYPNGPHVLDVAVADEAGQTAKGSMTINTRNAESIGLAITSPEYGATVSGVVPITLLASGGACTSRAFTLSIDGTQVFAKNVIGDQAVYSWDTTAVGAGAHTLTATVSDLAAHTATATTTVTVANDAGAKPVVSITAPSNGDWTGNSIDVAATATTMGATLASIKLYGAGGVFFTQPCSGTSCTVDTTWTTGPLPAGAYQMNAVATTTTGAQAVSSTVTIYKDATSPVYASGAPTGGGGAPPALTAAFGSPADGAVVSDTVEIAMIAGNADGSVTTFVLQQDGILLSKQVVPGSSATYLWKPAGTSTGPHVLQLTVTDAASRTATASIGVTVERAGGGTDTAPPTVAIASPPTGAWTGNSLHVIAQATDDVGLAMLRVYGDGVQFGETNCAGAAACAWDDWWRTRALSTGQHTITAVATDLAGNQTTSAPVTINK